MSNNINLLDFSSRVTTRNNTRWQKNLRILSIFLLFAISALSVVVFILIALSPIPQLRRQKADSLTRLEAVHGDIVKIVLINERLTNIKSFINNRTDLVDKVNFVQSKLSSDVAIDSVVFKENVADVTLSSKSLQSLNKFIDNLSNDGTQIVFKTLGLKNLSKNNNNDKFLLTISIDS